MEHRRTYFYPRDVHLHAVVHPGPPGRRSSCCSPCGCGYAHPLPSPSRAPLLQVSVVIGVYIVHSDNSPIQQIAKSKMWWFKALYPVSIPFFIFPFLLFNELLSIVFSISPHSMLRSIYHCIKISLCGLIGVLGQNDHPTSDLV